MSRRRKHVPNRNHRGKNISARDHREEYAEELAAPAQRGEAVRPPSGARRGRESETADSAWIGWGALAFAILSLFVWPAVFGSFGVIAGIIAYGQEQRSLGVWSIVIGLISLAAHFIMVPYYTT